MAKSSIFFNTNSRESTRMDLCNIFGIDPQLKPGRYLGLPIEWGKSKSEASGYIKNKIMGDLMVGNSSCSHKLGVKFLLRL